MKPFYKTTSEILATFAARVADAGSTTPLRDCALPVYQTTDQMLATFQRNTDRKAV